MTKSHDPVKEAHNRRWAEWEAQEKLRKAEEARHGRDPAQPGYGLPEVAPVEASRPDTALQRIVFRPGVLQYAYCLWAPVLCIGVGVALLLQWNVPGSVAFGVLFLGIGMIPALYVLGMRVEVDQRSVSKVFLFGLLRELIPRDQLACDAKKSAGTDLACFMRADGAGAFNLYPGYVWRDRHVQMLIGLSTGRFSWRDRKRQNRRLIAVLVALGVIGFILLMIDLRNECGTGIEGNVLGLPCH
jgi:hypothetical protein